MIGLLFSIVASAQQRSKANQIELWLMIKRELLTQNGREYFESSVQNAMLPWLKGTLVSATPPQRPGVLVLAMSDSSTPEVTLLLKDSHGRDTPLEGRIPVGSKIEFAGVPITFSQKPFMVTFLVESDRLKHPPSRAR